MTQASPSDRLDRIERILEQTVTSQAALQVTVQQNATAISDLRQNFEASVAELVSWIGEFVEQAEHDREVIREIQNEVRGIQTENQRILQYLFGEQQRE